MSRTRAALRISDDGRIRQQQLDFIAVREITVLREAGSVLWVSCAESQLPRLAEQGIGVTEHTGTGVLHLPALAFDPADGVPDPPAELAAAPGHPYCLVQFVAPPAPHWVTDIIALGGVPVADIPLIGRVFHLSQGAEAAIAALDFVSWLGPYHPAYAIAFGLTTRAAPFTMPTLRDLRIAPEALPEEEGANLEVGVFDDVDFEQIQAQLGETGAIVEQLDRWSILVSANAVQAQAIARIPGAARLERYRQQVPEVNQGRIIVGTDQVAAGRRRFLVDLNGAGEIAGVRDTGLDTGVAATMHPDLRGRVIAVDNKIPPDDDPKKHGHGTLVAGIIAGNGTQSAAQRRPVVGIAPAAFVLPQLNRKDNPLTRHLIAAYRAGARVHNNSWGAFEKPEDVKVPDVYRSEVDRFCTLHPDFLVVFSAGNAEGDMDKDGRLDMRSVDSYKQSKNILAVGATENLRDDAGAPNRYRYHFPTRYNHPGFDGVADGADKTYPMSDDPAQVALFSSRGLVRGGTGTSTGGVRPHLVAPGTNIVSLRSSMVPLPGNDQYPAPPTPLSDSHYRTVTSGTSFAAPHVTGAALLARQSYRMFFRRGRRQRLLEGVPAGPAVAFSALPASCPRDGGLRLAWITPAAPAVPKQLQLIRTNVGLEPLDPRPVTIGTDVGTTAAPRIARHGGATLVLHRQQGNGIQLRRLDPSLAPDPSFGTSGTVTVTSAASTAAERPAALLVTGDRVAVAWIEDASDVLRFRLYDAITGAPVSGIRELGAASRLSPHGAIAHDGTHFAVAWVDSTAGGRHRLLLQRIDATGAAAGGAVVVDDQPALVRDPHVAWDSARTRYLLAWVAEVSTSGGTIRVRLLDAAGAPIGGIVTPMSIPAGRTCRRPFIAPHPVHGAVLLWEDDTQIAAGNFDVYFALLDVSGHLYTGLPPDPNGVVIRPVVRVSDTLTPTSGFAAHTAPDGRTVVVWHCADESAPQRQQLGTFAVALTPDGTFEAPQDQSTPMISSGAYVRHQLAAYPAGGAGEIVSACWAGGRRFLARIAPLPGGTSAVELLRTSCDGLPDPPFPVPATTDVDRHALLWNGHHLIGVTAPHTVGPATVHVFDTRHSVLRSFGSRMLREPARGADPPELGFVPGTPQDPYGQILVGYQSGDVDVNRIRLAVLLSTTLADVGPAEHDLVPPLPAGQTLRTARHGWFRYVPEKGLVLAAFNVHGAGAVRVQLARANRQANGTFTNLPLVPLTNVAGEAANAAIATRPVGSFGQDALLREHLVAFQFRAMPTDPWEIRVSRVDQNGDVQPNQPSAPPSRDVPVISPSATGWPAATDATDPQVVCTYIDEPHSEPGPGQGGLLKWWSPGFGLAFLGQPTVGGNRRLHFTLLDEYGRRVLPPPPPGSPAGTARIPVPIQPISSARADVLDFTLAWTGRYFWLTWVENEAGTVRHCQTAITRSGSRMAYDAPSAALIRATLINGATNLAKPASPLPNLQDGFGWGRLDLRQSLAPSPPVTFHAREDAVGPGSTLEYAFELPPHTQLLRVTLAWDDPHGAYIVHPLSLHVVPPTGPPNHEYHGNQWDGGVSKLLPAGPRQVLENVQQVVVRKPPAGLWRVRIEAGLLQPTSEHQFPAQPMALVFVGSGQDVPFTRFSNTNRRRL